MIIPLPGAVSNAICALNSHGFEAYIVGGCVRDAIIGNTPNDWDITTSATPEQLRMVFSDYRTIETGLQHGTLTVLINDMPLEITTYRVDGAYSDGRHPDSVSFANSIEEDLKRRDFTINAMAYHPQEGLVDLFGGRKDIDNRCIRCVGDPHLRFTEDALRILRGLRFSATLGFAIEPMTDNALRELSSTLSKISAERITTEFLKMLCGQNAEQIIECYQNTIAVFLPELSDCNDFHLLSYVQPIARTRLAALLYGANISSFEAKSLLHRLRLDHKTIREVSLLLDNITKSVYTEDMYLLRLLNQVGPEFIFDYLSIREFDATTLRRAEQLLADGACYSHSMLSINGDDLIAQGVSPGTAVGEMLNDLLDAVMSGVCRNEKSALMDYLQHIKKPVQ